MITLLPFAPALAQTSSSNVSNTPFFAQATSIDKITGAGARRTLPLASGAVDNFRVDLGSSQLVEFNSKYTVVDDQNQIHYASDGIMAVPINIYTVSKTSDVATQKTSSYAWVTQLRMVRISEQSGTWGNFYDMTPGHPENYLGFCDVGIGACANPISWGAPAPRASDVALYRAGTSMTFTYDEYVISGTPNYIDSYANLVMTANFKPWDTTVANYPGVSIAIDDYQLSSPYVKQALAPQEIGAYDVKFSGTSSNNVSSHLEYVAPASSNLLPPEINAIAKAQTLNSQLGTTDFSKTPEGPTTVQQAVTQVPTEGAMLVDASQLPGVGQPVTFTMPNAAVRPAIYDYVQNARVGTATGVFEVKLNSGSFGSADVTLMPTVSYNMVKRIAYYYIQNYVAKFVLFFPFHLDSTVQWTGTTTSADLLADPNFSQSNVNLFLGLGGTTGFAVDLTRTPNVADWLDAFWEWLISNIWSILAILIAVAAIILVYMLIKSRISKDAKREFRDETKKVAKPEYREEPYPGAGVAI